MASVDIESSFALKERKLIIPIKLNCTNDVMHERGNLSCKVLSVMMRHLNSFNCFSFGNESLWTLTIL